VPSAITSAIVKETECIFAIMKENSLYVIITNFEINNITDLF